MVKHTDAPGVLEMKYIAIFIVLLGWSTLARAENNNIDLSTLPGRDMVQLTIYNAEDLTLVRETRLVTFKQGVNPLQFSWANTLIDPTSVEIQFLTEPDKLSVLDTTFPHDKPQELTWNIQSEFDGQAKVEISYFTSGISWSADYVGIADPDEAMMRLEGYVTVINRSGEDYEEAQVRLVVGRINLVEQIADLARRGLIERDDMHRLGRAPAMRRMVTEAESRDAVFEGAELAVSLLAAKQVVKEGLSEYFIFSIEGTETVPTGWSKRMRSFDAHDVPIRIQYRYRPMEYGDQLVRMYLLTNDGESNLGGAPLPDGTVRIFRETGHDSLAYLTTQTIRYIPIGDKIELNLGVDPEVVFELVALRTFRDNIWLKLRGADVLHRADQPGVRIDPRSTVEGWDEHVVYDQRVRNYTGKPIDVEIRRSFSGDVVFKSGLDAKSHDVRTVQWTSAVDASQTVNAVYEVVTKQGTNAEQQRVVIEAGEPAEPVWQ